MRVLVKQPTGKFCVFDTDIPLFVYDQMDLEKDRRKLNEHAAFRTANPRLVEAEVSFAMADVSWNLDDDWPPHPEGLGRWEKSLEIMVRAHGVERTKVLLKELDLGRYEVPGRIADGSLATARASGDFALDPGAMAVAAYTDMKEERA